MASAASSTRPPRVPRAFRVGSLGSGRRSPRRSRRASTPPVASAARGPHAVRVPLPASGPLAPPADVRAAVDRWPWRGGLEPCGDRPFAPIPPEAITGEIPSDLRGTLYRVGPGRCRVGATRYAHWFDGDGQIFAFAFGDDGRVSAGAKMVRTDRFVTQEGSGAPDRIAVRGAWTQASSPLQNLGRFPTNPGNTAPMAHAGKLFALCEGGGPIEIDRETLDTIGPHAFEGEKLPMGFSAHAKKDPRDGTLYTWGLAAPPAIGVVAAKIDVRGTVLKTAPLPLPPFAFTLIHDCAMSENYLAFIVPPWTLEPGAGMVGALSGAASFGHAFEWRGDERGATLIVLRKSDLGVVVGPREIHAMSTYHFAGAHEDHEGSEGSEGSEKKTLKIWVNELIGSRPNLEARFANMYDAEWAPDGYNLLAEYAVNLEDGTLESRDLLVPRASDADVEEAKKAEAAATRAARSSSSSKKSSAFAFDGQLPMEFPVAAAAGDASGGSGPPRFVYTLGFSGRGGGYFDAVQRLDVSNPRGPHHARLMPPGVFPSEVAFVPKRRKDEEKAEKREEEGYLVYLEYDASRHASDVVVLDAGDVAGAEIARVALPFHVPHTFHGEFEPSER